MKHCLQYAGVGGPGWTTIFIHGTELMSDEEIRTQYKTITRRNHNPTIERLNRCPLCESWIMLDGKLRNIDCPAVQEVIERNFQDACAEALQKHIKSHLLSSELLDVD